tara:strand:+ start:58 stop:702 length:645 start_codon:yes stop_codon:yes gene_type:complete
MPYKNKEKKKEYNKKYRLNNKEKLKQWRLDNKEQMKQYRLDNKEKQKKYNKKYCLDNKEKKEQYNKQWRLDNKEKIKQYRLDNKEQMKQWRLNNREKINSYYRNKLKTDPIFRFIKNQRIRMRSILKGEYKCKSTIKLLGCSAEYCWNHLEQQFKPGMTRDNYGLWHVDHIIPCASFDISDPEQQKICFHYTNLQPLWAIDNMKKGAKLDYEME